jgi:6-phosphogluconolactonase
VKHDVDVFPDAASVARAAAEAIAQYARASVAGSGQFTLAASGGRTPWVMFSALSNENVPWEKVVIFQVDERVAPEGDPARNITHLRECLAGTPARIEEMPVGRADLEAAAAGYAASLPARFDLVHLGLGPDGHTASLVPGDAVLGVRDRLVAVTEPYQGHRRMTLTYPALARAEQIMWLVTGADKVGPLAALLDGDDSIPAGRVEASRSRVLADFAAAGAT